MSMHDAVAVHSYFNMVHCNQIRRNILHLPGHETNWPVVMTIVLLTKYTLHS